ncbi:MAG: PspC domain-containing protein [Pseudomonadota bacterium]
MTGPHRRRNRRRSQGEDLSSQYRRFTERKRHGWGMGLYRNRRDGKICGVAAGIADYWDVANWVVRLMFIGMFLFTGSLALWAYVAGYFLLSPRPADRSSSETRRQRRRRRSRRRYEDDDVAEEPFESANEDDAFGPEMEYDERYGDYRPRRMFRYSESASVRLARARERLDAAVKRVEDMETYVTSRRFKLNSEFSKL